MLSKILNRKTELQQKMAVFWVFLYMVTYLQANQQKNSKNRNQGITATFFNVHILKSKKKKLVFKFSACTHWERALTNINIQKFKIILKHLNCKYYCF